MDWQSAFNIAAAMLGAVGGWLMKSLWSAVDRLRRDLSDIERSMHTDYLRKDDFNHVVTRIETKLDRIVERLEDKADRN
jgi:hypothetical protein